MTAKRKPKTPFTPEASGSGWLGPAMEFVGTVAGGAAGFFAGGPPGAAIGASIGGAAGKGAGNLATGGEKPSPIAQGIADMGSQVGKTVVSGGSTGTEGGWLSSVMESTLPPSAVAGEAAAKSFAADGLAGQAASMDGSGDGRFEALMAESRALRAPSLPPAQPYLATREAANARRAGSSPMISALQQELRDSNAVLSTERGLQETGGDQELRRYRDYYEEPLSGSGVPLPEGMLDRRAFTGDQKGTNIGRNSMHGLLQKGRSLRPEERLQRFSEIY